MDRGCESWKSGPRCRLPPCRRMKNRPPLNHRSQNRRVTGTARRSPSRWTQQSAHRLARQQAHPVMMHQLNQQHPQRPVRQKICRKPLPTTNHRQQTRMRIPPIRNHADAAASDNGSGASAARTAEAASPREIRRPRPESLCNSKSQGSSPRAQVDGNSLNLAIATTCSRAHKALL